MVYNLGADGRDWPNVDDGFARTVFSQSIREEGRERVEGGKKGHMYERVGQHCSLNVGSIQSGKREACIGLLQKYQRV